MKNGIYKTSNWAFELTKGIVIIAIILTLVNFFVVTVFVVEGASMEPNFHNGEALLTNRLSYLISTPQRGDVVISKFPGDPEHKKYIKRIIALPGEKLTIKDGLVYINDQKLTESYLPSGTQTLPDMEKVMGSDEYFIIGDNRGNSSDSRIWGPVEKSDLIGKAIFRFWPFDSFGLLEFPAY